tara:strand:+ start:1553 stop:3130 length:1578 start_codon:yes stop_codon:yes gene_type:complete
MNTKLNFKSDVKKILHKNLWRYIIFVPIILYFGNRSLVAYDEGIYALQAKWIIENNNWITPMKWGSIVADRTIGIQFLIAISQKIFGENMFAIYIPTILFGSLMIFLTYELHKELIDKKFSLVSPLILCTTFLWINYFHMATQDIIFGSLTTLGIYASIKSYKSNNKVFLFLAGIWIGLDVMMKTYLTFIPFIGILPFILKTKIYKNLFFWIGVVIGFLPFIFWSYQYININGWATYSGIYEKLITLSKDNDFTNPFYYYLFNLPLNLFPWTIFSIIGFFNISLFKKKLSTYFLNIYPSIIILLLSIFSTKTPYYPIMLLSLSSINAFIGIKVIFNQKNKLFNFLKRLNFTFIPILLLILIIYINFNKPILNFDKYQILILNVAVTFFVLPWLCLSFINSFRKKIILILLGPYLMTTFLVQSGSFSDRSKDIRIDAQAIVESRNLYDKKIEVITSGLSNEIDTKKIIKIALFMPKLGNGLNNINNLKTNQYAWISISNKELKSNKDYNIIYESNILNPWKLVIKN